MFGGGMFFGGGYGGYGGGYDGGVNRGGWAEKSGAATRRENAAKQLFGAFLEECKAKPESAFPITQDVVPCKVHLTSACWKTFKSCIEEKGCKAKRRQATPQEKLASKDKRKSKMYVVSITCPCHPGAAIEAAAAAKAKTAANKAKRDAAAKVKAASDAAARKAKAESDAAFQAAADTEFEKVVARQREGAGPGPGGAEPSPGSLGKRKRRNEEAPLTPASASGGAIPLQFLERAAQKAHMRQRSVLNQQFDDERRHLLKIWGERKADAEKTLFAENTSAKATLLAEQHVTA